jgi:SAM-dependent methyltransferase
MRWIRQPSTPESREAVVHENAADADIRLAYQLVLNRAPDQEGLRHYGPLVASGLPFRALIDALLDSDEYRGHAAATRRTPVPVGADAGPAMTSTSESIIEPPLIQPADIIAGHSVEELIETADEHYRSIADPASLMSRPFAYLHEAPVMLQSLGALLAGLQLGKTMSVLDFGAGTCWLSRCLAQLNCQPICCDVSQAALDIGRRLFAEQPPIGATAFTPVFLQFDGHRIALDDASVDRIVCFDALHHVPNVADVIAEFGRVLRPGGVAGFSEPGRFHSRSPQSQYEMRDHRVLENDVDLTAIFATARVAGFTGLTARVANTLEVSLDQYDAIVERRGDEVQRAIWNDTCETMRSRAVFFIHKGELKRDSRSHVGLAHAIRTGRADHALPRGARLQIDLDITNTGQAAWLSTNTHGLGIVRVGTHLYDRDAKLMAVDHSRHALPHDVEPGQSIAIAIEVPLPEDGDFVVGIDLVAEGVIWFENVGSKPLMVKARRTPSSLSHH